MSEFNCIVSWSVNAKRKSGLWLQLSFQVWSKKIQDMRNSRRRGDRAFREKDYEQAIDCYSQVSPFLYPILVMQYQTWCIKAQHQGFGHFISISLCEDVQLGWDFQFYNTHRFSDSCNLPLIWMLMGTGHIMFTSYIFFCSLLMLEHFCHQLCLRDVVWHICSMIRLRQLYVMLVKLKMSIKNGQLHVISKLLHFQSWEWKKMPRISWKKVLCLIAGGWTHGPLKITL